MSIVHVFKIRSKDSIDCICKIESKLGGEQGWNFKWQTLVKIAGNNQNLKPFLYSKLYFYGLDKILAIFDV